MKITRLEIPEVVLIEPRIFPDERGFFFEAFREDVFEWQGISKEKFVQDNHSRSDTGVLRGLHYQTEPKAQAKIVRVIRGKVFDVAVDVRPQSKTFGKTIACVLSEDNRQMLYIPKGFAHGFCVLEGPAEFLYKVSDFYSPQHERGILWSDPVLGIEWPKLSVPYILSDKDKAYPTLKEAFKNSALKP